MLPIGLAAALNVLACANTPGSPGTPSTSGAAAAPAYRVASGDSNAGFVTTQSGAAGAGGLFETMRLTRYAGGVDAREA